MNWWLVNESSVGGSLVIEMEVWKDFLWMMLALLLLVPGLVVKQYIVTPFC